MNNTTEFTGKKAPAFEAPVIGGNYGEGAISEEAKEILQGYGVQVEKSRYGKKYMGTERGIVIIGPDGKVKAVLRKVQPAEHQDLVLQALG